MMVNIFTDDLKNTRFILTVLALGLLAVFGLAIFILILFPPKDTIPEGIMALLTTLLGAVIAIVSVAYNSHFKAREEDAAIRADVAKAAAANVAAANVAAANVAAANVAAANVAAADVAAA